MTVWNSSILCPNMLCVLGEKPACFVRAYDVGGIRVAFMITIALHVNISMRPRPSMH